MNGDSLREFLAQVIGESMLGEQSSGPARVGKDMAEAIAREMITEAVAQGLPLQRQKFETFVLSGGNTAELVARFTLHAPFAFKLDSVTKKLAEEGKMIRAIRGNPRYPALYRQAWPIVYAVRDVPPYAYLMEFFPKEEGWLSLEDRLYPGEGKVVADNVGELGKAVLAIMFEGFEGSRDVRARPNLAEDYLGRISERLRSTTKQDNRFRSRPLIINGVAFEPWQTYVDLIGENSDFIDAITPPFSTVAHGDPNPGNIMLRTEGPEVEVKLIDPKEWGTGDYLFDITKLTHFLEGTGPIEKPAKAQGFQLELQDAPEHGVLTYRFDVPPQVRQLVDLCRKRVAAFAKLHGDVHWEARYELGMAANLLGLPLGRLDKTPPRPQEALALYGEGMKWLATFCARLSDRPATRPLPVQIADPGDIEPQALAAARDYVRSRIPALADDIDRRGFRLMHWPPTRQNDRGKPVELSLEHEARLKPDSKAGLSELRSNLQLGSGRICSDLLLPGDREFGGLVVEPHERPPGPQSVDLYYDLVGATGTGSGMIPHMLSLRERQMGSAFMTWNSGPGAGMRPLNLELPLVTYGESGVIARLEFNWIDDLALSVADYLAATGANEADHGNPLYLAAMIAGFERGKVEPVVSHTTFRSKYTLTDPGRKPGEEAAFDINIDHIVVQSLLNQRVATYTDVDIAPRRVVDGSVLGSLIRLSTAMSARYRLTAINATKAWRDMAQTGDLKQHGPSAASPG